MRQPNYKLAWFVPNQVAGLTHFHADVTAEDFAGVIQLGQQLFARTESEFHVIIDNRVVEFGQLLCRKLLRKIRAAVQFLPAPGDL